MASFESKRSIPAAARFARFLRLTLVTGLLFFTTCEKSLATDEGFQWWLPVFAEFPILNSKLRGYAESNPRLNDGLNGMNQYLLRTALGVRPRKNIEFFQGYGYVNTYRPTGRVQEHRPYQQLGYGHVLFERLQVLHRIRTEQRIFEQLNGCSNRFRYMLRVAMPIKKTRWYLATSDELFITLNSIEGGPVAGFDQNRYYAALGRQVNNNLRFEIGYQNQFINQANQPNKKSNHTLMTQAFINF